MTNAVVSPQEMYAEALTKFIFRERFYASLLNKMRVSWSTTKVPTAGVYVTDKINMVLNPTFVKTLSIEELMELLRHECNHILYKHISRSKELGAPIADGKKEVSMEDMIKHKLFNLSADAAINHDCPNLVNNKGGVSAKKLEEMLIQETGDTSINIDARRSMEHYYGYLSQIEDKMQQDAKELGDKLKKLLENGNLDDHGIWDESTGGSDLIEQVIKSAVGKAAKEARGAGSVSSDLDSLIEDLLSSKVDWKKELNRFFVNSLKYDKERTRKKRNRRYGYLFSGRKKKPQLSVAVILDVSGSVSDNELAQFHSEIKKMHQFGVQIHVVQSDTEVKGSYEFNPKEPFRRLAAGGTFYDAPLQYVANKLEADIAIFFGDGDCADTPRPINIPVVWAFMRGDKRPADFGKLIKIDEQE